MQDFFTESVINLVSDGIIVMDETGIILSVNTAANHLFGYSGQEITGQSINLLLPEIFTHSKDTGELKVNGIGRQTSGRKKNGTAFPLTITITDSSFLSEKRFIAVMREVAEKKRSGWEQEDKLNQLQLILDHLPDPVWYKDSQGRYVYINKQYEQYLGKSAAEVQGLTDFDLMSEKRAKQAAAVDDDAWHSGKKVSLKEIWQEPNGKQTFKKVAKMPIYSKGGPIQGILSVAHDISEWRQIEELYTYFEKIIDDTFFEIYVFSSDLKYVYLNKCASRSSGYSIEDIHSLGPLDLWTSFTDESFQSLIEPLWQGTDQDIIRFETIHKRKDGTFYPVEVKLQLVNPDEPSPLFMAVIQDITVRKRVEEIQRKAEQAVLYSNFLAD